MSVVHYIAIIEAGDGPGFGVFFPDLPGCTSAGDTLEEAGRNAQVALNLHLASMIEHGDALPAPSGFKDIRRDPDVREAARILVRGEVAARAERINITLAAPVLAALDAMAAERDLDRSTMIATLVRRAAAPLPARQGKASGKGRASVGPVGFYESGPGRVGAPRAKRLAKPKRRA